MYVMLTERMGKVEQYAYQKALKLPWVSHTQVNVRVHKNRMICWRLQPCEKEVVKKKKTKKKKRFDLLFPDFYSCVGSRLKL